MYVLMHTHMQYGAIVSLLLYYGTYFLDLRGYGIALVAPTVFPSSLCRWHALCLSLLLPACSARSQRPRRAAGRLSRLPPWCVCAACSVDCTALTAQVHAAMRKGPHVGVSASVFVTGVSHAQVEQVDDADPSEEYPYHKSSVRTAKMD